MPASVMYPYNRQIHKTIHASSVIMYSVSRTLSVVLSSL